MRAFSGEPVTGERWLISSRELDVEDVAFEVGLSSRTSLPAAAPASRRISGFGAEPVVGVEQDAQHPGRQGSPPRYGTRATFEWLGAAVAGEHQLAPRAFTGAGNAVCELEAGVEGSETNSPATSRNVNCRSSLPRSRRHAGGPGHGSNGMEIEA